MYARAHRDGALFGRMHAGNQETALARKLGVSAHRCELHWVGADRLNSLSRVGRSHVHVSPVINQHVVPHHQRKAYELFAGKARPTPLILQFVETVLTVFDSGRVVLLSPRWTPMNLRSKFIVAISIGIASMPIQALIGKVDFTREGDFSEAAVQRGVKASKEQCAKVANAVWADAGSDRAECLKYWMAGFGGSATRAPVVFFHGDVWVGAGKTSASFLDRTNEKLQRDANANAKRLGVPYIFFARPETYGSSGEHMQRRRPAESRLTDVALSEIKRRHGIEKFVVAGQSGGGYVTSSLLTYRSDVICAVPTSAPSSPRILQTIKGWARDSTGYNDSYKPTEHLQRDRIAPYLRAYSVSETPQILTSFGPLKQSWQPSSKRLVCLRKLFKRRVQAQKHTG